MNAGAQGGRQRGVHPRWQAVLSRHLPEEAFRQLQVLSRDWRENPFAYDALLEQFEVADAWADAHAERLADEQVLDVLLRACDVLTEHRRELGPLGPAQQVQEPANEETIELVFDFPAAGGGARGDDEAVARTFLQLLQGETAYRVREEDLGALRRVWVRFGFRGEFEYQARKSHLDWLLELARRLRHGRPFQGERL